MINDYKVKVNKTIDFDLTSKAISEIDMIEFDHSKYHILQDNISIKATLTTADFNNKKYTVKVNDNNYDISIIDDLDVLIGKMGFALGKSKKVNTIKSPMPGLLLNIPVKTGQKVKENEVLLVLEAMKMENSIVSPREGVIKSVLVNEGDTVDKDVLLIEFEAEK